jgi:hypothetical protein
VFRGVCVRDILEYMEYMEYIHVYAYITGFLDVCLEVCVLEIYSSIWSTSIYITGCLDVCLEMCVLELYSSICSTSIWSIWSIYMYSEVRIGVHMVTKVCIKGVFKGCLKGV